MGTKVFDNALDLITFTRSSSGTYLDSDGLLKTASTNIPRIEYDAAGAVKGLLVEEARTNLLLRSEEFDNAAWQTNVGACTVVPNAVAAPDGNLTADELTFVGTNANRYASVSGLMIGASYTFSVWLRVASGSATMSFGNIDGGIFQSVTVTDSWQRFSVTQNATGTTRFPTIRGTDLTAYAWGAQLEAGAFPTSYIPTAGATATRAADIASIPVSAFGYNQQAGSVVVEATTSNSANIAASRRPYTISGVNSQVGATFIYDNGVFDLSDAGASGGKHGTTIKSGSMAIVNNAGTPRTSSASLDGDYSSAVVNIGGYVSGTNLLNGHIRSISYYPRRLSNAQLQELTT